MDWYALFVKTGREEIIQTWLNFYFKKSDLHCVVPKRKLSERKKGKVYQVVKKMFPGYVLIYTEMNTHSYKKIINIPNLIKILNYNTYYSCIEQKEIQPILDLIGNGEVIDYSKIYFENSKVFVKSGPLHGMEGIIKKVDKRKNRAKIQIDFMGTQKMIDLGIEVLKNL